MPKEELIDDGRKTDSAPTVEYPFTLRSLTLRDVGKVPGPMQYSSREYGLPYATFDVDWPGKVIVPANPHDPLAELGAAVRALTHWVKDIGVDLGREIVADIKLDVAEGKLDDKSSIDIDEL